METESGRSSIRGNIYFGAVAARIYTDEYIIWLRILWEFLVQKCQLFEIHVLPLLQEVRPNVLLASLSHLNVTLKQEYYLNSQTPSKAEIFCNFCSIRISQRKHSGSHFQILQNICLM